MKDAESVIQQGIQQRQTEQESRTSLPVKAAEVVVISAKESIEQPAHEQPLPTSHYEQEQSYQQVREFILERMILVTSIMVMLY